VDQAKESRRSMMLRTVVLAALIGTLAAPAFARGGGGDVTNERLAAEAKKYRDAGQRPPNLFDFLFSDNKKKTKPTTSKK